MSEHSTKCQIETIEYSLVPLKTNLLKVVTLNAVRCLNKKTKGHIRFLSKSFGPDCEQRIRTRRLCDL